VQSKSRLGTVVHKKTATCLALTDVKPEDQGTLAKIVDSVRLNFNDRSEEVRKSPNVSRTVQPSPLSHTVSNVLCFPPFSPFLLHHLGSPQVGWWYPRHQGPGQDRQA